MEKASGQSIRLDKWLKIARIFKTRSQASRACDENQVKVNGEPARSAKLIKPGDKLTVKGRNHLREIQVTAVCFKSVSVQEARELYQEEKHEAITEESRELMRLMKRSVVRYPGRPTKKERRDLMKIRGY